MTAHVASMGQMRNAYTVLVGKSERGRDHLRDLGVDGGKRTRILVMWGSATD